MKSKSKASDQAASETFGFPELDDVRLAVATDWLVAMHPAEPVDSMRRSVALVYRAVLSLLAEPWAGKFPDPNGFRIALEAIARRTRDLSPSRPKPRYVDPTEVQACLDALIAGGAFVVVTPANPIAPAPRKRAAMLALPDWKAS